MTSPTGGDSDKIGDGRMKSAALRTAIDGGGDEAPLLSMAVGDSDNGEKTMTTKGTAGFGNW